MATKKKVSKKPAKKRTATKKTSTSAKDKKMQVIEECLQEIYHLIGHSVDAGAEESTPLKEIVMVAAYLHNEVDRAHKHKIKQMVCECKDPKHAVALKDFQDDCMHE